MVTPASEETVLTQVTLSLYVHNLYSYHLNGWLSTTLFLFFELCVSGVQEGAQPFPILLQMCDGSCIGRRGGLPHSEGTNCAAGLPRPLFQQSGVYH